jgi:hypothetical protein
VVSAVSLYAWSAECRDERPANTPGRIPFERALALANQEKITEQLYPLFVHQIDSLLYHPANAARQIPPPGAYPEEQKMSPVQVPEGDDRRPRL